MFGAYAYRYKNKYYRKYVAHNAHAGGLGTELVSSIPTDPDEFFTWYFRKMELFKNFEENVRNGILCGFEERDYCPIVHYPVEWVYVIDLDHLQFILDGNVFFRLDNIPRGEDNMEWIKYIQLDGRGHRCHHPTTPARYLALQELPSYVDCCLPGRLRTLYMSLQPKILDPDEWTRTESSRPILNELTLFVVKGLLEDCYGIYNSLAVSLYLCEEFIEPAKHLLLACTPGVLHISQELAKGAFDYQRWTKDPPPARVDCSWFRNCLIIIASCLHMDLFLGAWVGFAVEKLREVHSPGSTVTALLWSVRHAVAVVLSDEGVAHSRAIPVVDVFGVDDTAFAHGIDFLMHFLRPSFVDFTKVPQSGHVIHDVDNSRPIIPFDVVMRILDFVDVETYNTCSTLSRTYRVYWANHPRVGPFKLSKARPNTNGQPFKYPNPVGAVRCDDLSPESQTKYPSLGIMYFYHSEPKYTSYYDNMWGLYPETHLYTHLTRFDASNVRDKFTLATLSLSKAPTDYLVTEHDMPMFRSKKALSHELDEMMTEPSRSLWSCRWDDRGEPIRG